MWNFTNGIYFTDIWAQLHAKTNKPPLAVITWSNYFLYDVICLSHHCVDLWNPVLKIWTGSLFKKSSLWSHRYYPEGSAELGWSQRVKVFTQFCLSILPTLIKYLALGSLAGPVSYFTYLYLKKKKKNVHNLDFLNAGYFIRAI